ncbi:MAG: tetratricopeptide repeat protein [Cyanobacteria bacterium]|nr:tetratricopeptide repeat protein [Cyanobacteriota bacterium]
MLGSPPDTVPDNLTAEEYLELGLWYHAQWKYDNEAHWMENARTSLTRAKDLDSNGDVGRRAARQLDQHIPCNNVSSEVLTEFERLHLNMFHNATEGERKLQSMIEREPLFDWPYHRLAEFLMRNKGDLAEARFLLEQSLEINPQSSRGHLAMAELQLTEGDYSNARQSLDKAMAIAPDSEDGTALRRTLDLLIAID